MIRVPLCIFFWYGYCLVINFIAFGDEYQLVSLILLRMDLQPHFLLFISVLRVIEEESTISNVLSIL